MRDSDAPPELPDTLPGTVIAGNFEILDRIGEGAMGRVYRARQISLDKIIAIKVLHRHLAQDPKIAKRFHREARAASKLSHPGSLQVMDFGEAPDGTLYIAMELLDGVDLQDVIERDFPFTPLRIVNILGQVLAALEDAHGAGIVHRDLKPENIIVLAAKGATGERVKVCDFGIAKITEQEGGSAITMAGFVCGTPEYMAPEQARGDDVDARADLYAAGIILYQLLTGVVPYSADSALGTITKHLVERPIPPRKRRPDLQIPDALEAICLKALEKDRERRYSSATEMRLALERAASSLGARASLRPAGTRTPPDGATPAPVSRTADVMAADLAGRRAPRWVYAATPIAIFFLIGGIWSVTRSEPTAHPVSRPPRTTPVAEPDAGVAVIVPPSAADAGVAVVALALDAGPTAAPVDHHPTRFVRDAGHNVVVQAPINPPPPPPPPTPPPHVVEGPTPESAFDRGRRLFLTNDVPGAIAAFEQAAHEQPGNAQAQKQLGRAYMRAGNVASATAAYRRYLELSPNASDREIIESILAQHGG